MSDFDPAPKELIIMSKLRGWGDCGTRAVPRIVKGEAVLKEFGAKFDCDSKEWLPGKAPVIYRR